MGQRAEKGGKSPWLGSLDLFAIEWDLWGYPSGNPMVREGPDRFNLRAGVVLGAFWQAEAWQESLGVSLVLPAPTHC